MRVNREVNVIISCYHSVFNKLMEKGRVNINWKRHNIREFIRPTQSFKFYKYGHLARNCRGQAACYNCGHGEHK